MGPGIRVSEDSSSSTMRILGLPVGLLAILFNCELKQMRVVKTVQMTIPVNSTTVSFETLWMDVITIHLE